MLLMIKQFQQNNFEASETNTFRDRANSLTRFWQIFKNFSTKTEKRGGVHPKVPTLIIKYLILKRRGCSSLLRDWSKFLKIWFKILAENAFERFKSTNGVVVFPSKRQKIRKTEFLKILLRCSPSLPPQYMFFFL